MRVDQKNKTALGKLTKEEVKIIGLTKKENK